MPDPSSRELCPTLEPQSLQEGILRIESPVLFHPSVLDLSCFSLVSLMQAKNTLTLLVSHSEITGVRWQVLLLGFALVAVSITVFLTKHQR